MLYAETDKSLCALIREPERYRCFFYAEPISNVHLDVTQMDMPVYTGLIYPKPYPPDPCVKQFLAANGFAFVRTMQHYFYDTLKLRNEEANEEVKDAAALCFAEPNEKEKIDELFRMTFDPCLDMLFTQAEMEQAIVEKRVLVLREAGKVAAAAAVAAWGEIMEWRSLAVFPQYQGRGLGLRLSKQIQALACFHGYKKISFWTDEKNSVSQAMYAKAGFTLDKRRCDDYLF